jgi:hypothetical protein
MSGFLDGLGSAADTVFHYGDEFLNHGGQSALDLAGVASAFCEPIPVVGEVAAALNLGLNEGQAAYHGYHALNDLRHGNNREALSQGAEAVYHGALPLLGPNAGALEAGVAGWDTLAAGINWMGGGGHGAAFDGEGHAVPAPAIAGNALADLLGVKDHGEPANSNYAE